MNCFLLFSSCTVQRRRRNTTENWHIWNFTMIKLIFTLFRTICDSCDRCSILSLLNLKTKTFTIIFFNIKTSIFNSMVLFIRNCHWSLTNKVHRDKNYYYLYNLCSNYHTENIDVASYYKCLAKLLILIVMLLVECLQYISIIYVICILLTTCTYYIVKVQICVIR